jgi:hypothetical protein
MDFEIYLSEKILAAKVATAPIFAGEKFESAKQEASNCAKQLTIMSHTKLFSSFLISGIVVSFLSSFISQCLSDSSFLLLVNVGLFILVLFFIIICIIFCIDHDFVVVRDIINGLFGKHIPKDVIEKIDNLNSFATRS